MNARGAMEIILGLLALQAEVIRPRLFVALVIMALAVWQITGDGEAVAFEGWALVALYIILAVLTFYE